jgi:spermidine synthase
MKPFERLGEARAPDGTLLTLHRHDGSYILRVNGVELMSTRRSNSEMRLAQIACAPLQARAGARVLIGGLGLGFTLQEALRLLPADATVVVAEIVREVIEWNSNPDYALAGAAMSDPRVDVRHDDVANVLREAPAAYDAILLDVDNGAECLTTAGNAQLYADAGIRQAVAALRDGGILAYWSAEADPRFVKALHRAGMQVETQRVRAHATFGGFHTLLFARRRDAGGTARASR